MSAEHAARQRAHRARHAEKLAANRALLADGWSQVRIAARFGVTQANISCIKRGKSRVFCAF